MKLTTTIASAAVAGVLGLAGVSVAGAAATGSSHPASATPPTSTTVGNAPGRTQGRASDRDVLAKRAVRRHHRRRELVLIAARTIGIDGRDLVREIRAGKTIAKVATEHGVRPQAVIDALNAAAAKRIDAARDAGRITAERAVRLQQRVNVVIAHIVNEWHPRPRRSG